MFLKNDTEKHGENKRNTEEKTPGKAQKKPPRREALV
jgi:hypothetical protein